MKGNAKESNKGATGMEDDSAVSSKKAKKVSYENKLEEITKELRSKSTGSSSLGKGLKKQKLKPEQEVVLLEQKCILLLKLKRHKEVVDDGYSIIGRLGPNIVVYKCILIALVRLGKAEEDIVELLEAWRKATPKCTQMLETKRKFDGFLTALRSGMKHNDIFSGIEEALGLNADIVLSKQLTNMEESKWKCRAPPPRHTTFSMCPRASSGSSCIYGEECLFAHSLDELKEWKLRVDVDKKNNIGTDEMGDESSRTGKKRPIPNIYRSLLIPPLCIHYLLDLGKKIKEAGDIQDVLVDEIPSVKIKVGTPLKYQKRVDGINNLQCTWTFMVGSKMPMGTVSILHDSNRESFSISGAVYYNKKKESISLIELHPNNQIQTKLQVLNTFIQPSLFLRFNSGWPDTCYYKVDVTWSSSDPFPEAGLYRQSIVFDFKKDPKVVKHIAVEVLPKMEPIGNHLEASQPIKSPWATTLPPVMVNDSEDDIKDFELEQSDLITCASSLEEPQNNRMYELPFKAVGFKSMAIIDSESGQSIKLNSVFSSGSYDSDASKEENLFFEDVPLTKENYRNWWHDFLDAEHAARQKAVKQIKTLVDVMISQSYTPSSECFYKYNYLGELYGKIEMISEICLDPKLDYLITNNCTSVLIYTSTDTVTVSFRKTTPRYMCKIVEKSNSAIFIAIGRVAVDDLLLIPDSIRQLHVQFVIDACVIDEMKFTVDALSKHHMKLLFPSFETTKLPVLKPLNSTTLLNEEELFFNGRQQGAYNIITGRRDADTDIFIPPVLLTGGVSTGKSYLLAHSLRGLLRSHTGVPLPRILICTRNDHVADMYITDYLHKWLINDELSVQRSKPLRVYNVDRFVDSVCGAVKHYCLFNYDGTNFRYPTKEEVLSHKIIIVTVSSCSTLLRLGLDSDTFSHIIIDEAAQCLESESIEPIALAGKFTRLVLAGDVALTQSQMFTPTTRVSPLSLLERLRNMYPFRHPFVVNLIENFSNHEVILKFISGTFYHDQLRPASNQPCHPRYYPVGFHHISANKEIQADNGGGYYNMDEIRGISDFIDELLRTWPANWGKPQEKNNLIVVTPYINHIKGLRVQLQLKGLQWINVDLASNLTSKTFRVVILSTVRSHNFVHEKSHIPEDMHSGFFSNRWLISTAMSSGKSLVMVFGDLCSLLQHGDCRDIWHKFATECQSHNSLLGFTAQEGVQVEDAPAGICYRRSPPPRDTPTLQVGQPKVGRQGLPSSLGMRSLDQNHSIMLHNERSSPRHTPVSNAVALQMSSSGMSTMNSYQALKGEPNNESGNPWNNVSLAKAPKTDLFSAFSSDVKPLYSSTPSPLLDIQHENQTIIESQGKANLSSQALTTIIPNTLSGLLGNRIEVPQKQGLKSDASVIQPPTVVLRKTSSVPMKSMLDMYSSSFELASHRKSVNSSDKLGETEKLKQEESMNDLAGINMIEPQQMPLPIPTIPSQVLFDTKLVIGMDRENQPPKTFERGSEALGFGSSPCLSPQKFISPLMRGPPGFAPLSYETKIGNLSEDSYPSVSSPQKSYLSNGKQSYKRNTYELPPRMLKNLHLAVNQRSPIRKKMIPRQVQAAEMNFFEELGLDSQRESYRSTSSASSDQSFMDPDETICIVEEDSSSLSPQSDWIEVKSTRKGKNHHGKTKSKERRNVVSEDVEENADMPEMCVDDKVDIITQMGFTKSEATRALQECEKDLQRAVDWLISKPSIPGS